MPHAVQQADIKVPLFLAPYTIPATIPDANNNFVNGSFQPHITYAKIDTGNVLSTFYSLSLDPFAFFLSEKSTPTAGIGGPWSGPILFGDTVSVWLGNTGKLYRSDLPNVLGGVSPLIASSIGAQFSLYNTGVVGGGFGGGTFFGSVDNAFPCALYDNFDYLTGPCNIGAGLSFVLGQNGIDVPPTNRQAFNIIKYVTLADGSVFNWNCPKVFLLNPISTLATMLWQDQATSRVYRIQFVISQLPAYPPGPLSNHQCPGVTLPYADNIIDMANPPLGAFYKNERVTFDDATLQTAFETAFAGGAAFQRTVFGLIMTGLPARFGHPQGVMFLAENCTEYSYLNFIPETPSAISALAAPGRTYDVAQDLFGYFYLKVGGGLSRNIYHSFGLQIPSLYPGNQQPVSLPCFNPCEPVPIGPVEGA